MKDEARIILNTLLAHVSRFASMGVAFLMVPFLIGRLGEETYGIIGIAGSILTFMTLVEFGVRPATDRQYTSFLFGNDIRRANQIVSTSMAFYLGLAVAILLLIGVLGRRFLGTMQVSDELLTIAHWTLFAAGLSLATNLVTTPYRAALVAHLRHDIQHYTETLTAFLRAAVIVLGFWLWSESLLVWGAAAVISALVLFWVTRERSFRVSPTLEIRPSLVSRGGWRDLSTLSVDTTLSDFSSWLTMQSGPMIISYYLGSASVTHYAPVLVIVNMLLSFSLSFITQLNPVMTKAVAQANVGLMKRSLVRSARYSILVSGSAAVWVAVHASLIVPAWLGEGFEDTALVLILWCWAVVLRTCTGAAFPVFLAMNRLRGIAIFNVFLAAASLALAIYLVGFREQGILGVAIAAIVGQVIRTIVRVVFAAQLCDVRLFEFVRRAYPGTLFSLAAMAGVAWAIQEFVAVGIWPKLMLSGAASLVAFAAAAWALGLNSDDRAKVRVYARGAWEKLRNLV